MKKTLIVSTVAALTFTCTPVYANVCTDPSILNTFTDGSDKGTLCAYTHTDNVTTETESNRIDVFINKNLYPATGIVTAIAPSSDDRYEDITITHANGNDFQFTAPTTDCWEIGDLASCIMDANGTENTVYDDKVLSAWYCGSPDQFSTFIK